MDNKRKNILLGVLIVGVISMTVAFAALSSTLSISGTANVDAAKWDIHFENWAAAYPTNGQIEGVQNKAVQTTAASMTPSTKGTLISGLVVTLNQPGDIAKYKFDIVNDGTINAKLDTFTKSIVINNTSTVPEDITYTVVCGDEATKPVSGAQALTNAAAPTQNDTLGAGNSRACVLTVIYDEVTNTPTAGQAQTYTGTARTLSITANWVWVQGNASANNSGSGSEQSGGQEQSGSNEEPASNYTYRLWDEFGWDTALTNVTNVYNQEYKFYLRKNTDTNKEEGCLELSQGTACVEQHSYDCTFNNGVCSDTSSYLYQMQQNFENKGATCFLDNINQTFKCEEEIGDGRSLGCYIALDGETICYDDWQGHCDVRTSGSSCVDY